MNRPDSVRLRLARQGDAEIIAGLSRDLIETGLGWSWSPERVSRSFAEKNTVTLIAAERGRVVAFAIAFFGEEHVHISLLAVRPSHQRQGIGRRMMEWLLKSARVVFIPFRQCLIPFVFNCLFIQVHRARRYHAIISTLPSVTL